MKWGTHYSPIGLDIGSHQIKLVQLKGKGPRCTVHQSAVVPLPHAGDATTEASHEQIVYGLRTGLGRRGFVGKNVVSLLPSAEVDIRTIALPLQIEAQELPAAIRQEAASYLSYPLEEAVLDYIAAGEEQHDGVTKRRLIVVSTPRQCVEAHLALLQQAGLYCLAIEVLPLALSRFLLQHHRVDTEAPVLVVDIGHSDSTAFILWQGVLMYSRTFGWGGNMLTQAIMKELTLSYDQAERLKQQHGIDPQATGLPTLDETQQRLNMQAMPGLLWEIVRPQLEAFAEELERIVAYWGARYRGAQINHLLLSGGGAALPGCDSYLQQRMGLDVAIIMPLLGDKISPPSPFTKGRNAAAPDTPALTTAMGLALRGGV